MLIRYEGAEQNRRRMKALRQIKEIPNVKTILYFTSVFGAANFAFGFGQKPFLEAGCPVNNCYATNGKQTFAQRIFFTLDHYAPEQFDTIQANTIC